ncbi:MAG: helix-turn-helix transcriptional regulator [Verrucomicrobiae bacterium]|nr:helix-turn-helix transcriptional regulator [Verrucomicrobiae bacterium]
MSAVLNRRVTRPVPPKHRVHTRPMGSAMFSEHAWQELARSLKFSMRELQIARGIFDDDSDVGIAHNLGISLHTVHTHVERLHRKLAVTNRRQLLLRVVQEFLTLTVAPENDLPPLCANHASRACPFCRKPQSGA